MGRLTDAASLDPAQILRNYFTTEMSRDVDAILDTYDPAASFETPDARRVGHDEIRPFYVDAAKRFPVLHVELLHVFSRGDWAVAEWSARMTSAAGDTTPLSGVNVARVAEGRLVEVRSYYDTGSYLPATTESAVGGSA